MDNNFSCGHNRGIYYFVCIACQEKNCWKLSKFAPSTSLSLSLLNIWPITYSSRTLWCTAVHNWKIDLKPNAEALVMYKVCLDANEAICWCWNFYCSTIISVRFYIIWRFLVLKESRQFSHKISLGKATKNLIIYYSEHLVQT